MNRQPSHLPSTAGNQRGIALVMALLVLLVVSLLSVTLMLSLNVETKIAGHSLREAQALNVAEAGVGEALARIRVGDVPNDLNPRLVAQIFLAAPGSVPVLSGPDSVALGTGQPAGQWLDYSTANKSADVLTVTYKTDAAKTVIYKYDENKNPAVQTASGLPIYVVSATGRKGQDIRRIVAEVIQKPYNVKVNAALAADQGIDFSGTSNVCGYNHLAETPAWTPAPHGLGCQAFDAGCCHLTGAWSTNTITSGGAAQQNGWPDPTQPGQTDFYAGPWELLGMTQAEYFSWVGAPLPAEPASPKGVFYMDNNAVTQDQSGDFAFHGGNGEGLVYADGDLSINGNFTFRGLIYLEGDLKINGTVWILGALVAKGKSRIKLANGTCAILYSKDAIAQNIAKYGGQFVTLSWREK